MALTLLIGLAIVVYFADHPPSFSSHRARQGPGPETTTTESAPAAAAVPIGATADADAARRREAKELYLYAQNAQAAKDLRRAVELYEKACAAGEIGGCAMAGYLYAEGKKGVPKDYAKALEFDSKACDGNNAMGCNNLGVLYGTGKAVRRDWNEAITNYEEACRLGEKMACDNLKSARWNVAVEASALWRAYDQNEVAADNKWKGQQLTIVGALQSIEKDFRDAVILQLRSPNQFIPTRAYLSSSQVDTAAHLKKGQKVLLTCECDGRIMGAPVLKDCAVVDSAAAPRYDDDDE